MKEEKRIAAKAEATALYAEMKRIEAEADALIERVLAFQEAQRGGSKLEDMIDTARSNIEESSSWALQAAQAMDEVIDKLKSAEERKKDRAGIVVVRR